jgi:hypothetical protein
VVLYWGASCYILHRSIHKAVSTGYVTRLELGNADVGLSFRKSLKGYVNFYSKPLASFDGPKIVRLLEDTYLGTH